MAVALGVVIFYNGYSSVPPRTQRQVVQQLSLVELDHHKNREAVESNQRQKLGSKQEAWGGARGCESRTKKCVTHLEKQGVDNDVAQEVCKDGWNDLKKTAETAKRE